MRASLVARFDVEGEARLWGGRRGRVICRAGPVPKSSDGCWTRVGSVGGGQTGSPEMGVPARTVTRILRRHHMPRLCECDPLTGQVVRASKTATIRYERDRPGELIHMDVKSSAGSQTGAAGGPTAKKWDPLASRNELGSDPTTSIQ